MLFLPYVWNTIQAPIQEAFSLPSNSWEIYLFQKSTTILIFHVFHFWTCLIFSIFNVLNIYLHHSVTDYIFLWGKSDINLFHLGSNLINTLMVRTYKCCIKCVCICVYTCACSSYKPENIYI